MSRFICGKCDASYSLDEPIWRCDCGGTLDLDFKPSIDPIEISKRKPTLWRYREPIPIRGNADIVSFDEGFTPLLEVELESGTAFIKQDQLFSSGSYKDRGATVLVSKVKELGIGRVVIDSSGNAACAVAAYCAKAGIECEVFVPESTSPAKLIQIKAHGATLNRIPGSREDTANAVLESAGKHYYASHYWNPFFFQGTKTFAYEVCEQLGWRAPDSVVLPVGNGTLILGSHIGFNEMINARIIDRMPKLIAVQSSNCAPLLKAFKENLDAIPKINTSETIAEGIAIAEPIRGMQIIEAVRNSKGDFIAVGEEEIGEALANVSAKGFYIEPTSAATIAGLDQYLAQSSSDETVVSIFTGHGLKSAK